MTSLEEQIRTLPEQPGVYLFKGRRGEPLYVGKALSLRKRVLSYFQRRELHAERAEKIAALLPQIASVEVIVTDSELEALILESNLIKDRQPRYNVVLRDDKHYPFLKLDLSDPWPRLQVVRRVKHDQALYFGPYVPATSMWQLLHLINKAFPLRKCTNIQGRRLCLDYHLGRCLGPCEGLVAKTEYDQVVEQVRLVLEGKDRELAKRIEGSMQAAAEAEEFERAARLRDELFALREVRGGQKALSMGEEDEDIFGVAVEGGEANVQLFIIRRGRLIGRESFPVERGIEAEPAALLGSLLKQFYLRRQTVPPEVLISHPIEDAPVITEWLSQMAGHRVQLRVPERGRKARLTTLAVKNAAIALGIALKSAGGRAAALADLQEAFRLPRPPKRIEAYDISNIQGTAAVGSQVVFEEGQPNRSAYRRYRIKGIAGPDDFAMLEELLRRRIARAKETPLPDLILIDGGRGQLNVGVRVLKETGFPDQPVLSLAKAEEMVFHPGMARPIPLKEGSRIRHLLQQIRDEAHRFAITYHKKVRGKAAMHSVLDEIPGIGAKRKQVLLAHFGSLKGLQLASIEEIRRVGGLPNAMAATVHDFLQALTD